MTSQRLIQHIQDNSGKLTADLVVALHHDPRTSAYRSIPAGRLMELKGELYEQLGRWLSSRTKAAVESRYRKVGRERYLAEIPLSQLICALNLTKAMLFAFIARATPGDPPELPLQHELVLSISEFFDEATYYASVGYEDASRASLAAAHETTALLPHSNLKRAKRRPPALVQEVGEIDLAVSRGGDIGEAPG